MLIGRSYLLLRGLKQAAARSHCSRIRSISVYRNPLCSVSTTIGSTKNENEVFNPEGYINRNPMNLERQFLAYKPSGFPLDNVVCKYWNKAVLEKTNKHTTAKVVHHTGKVVVVASTQEWAIRKHLYSATDINAVRNVARVLSQRCLESGILFVSCDYTEEESPTERMKIFMEALQEGGVSLKEPDPIEAPDTRQV